ncbi:MAG TPA: antibiotic biosynthesis monooxygenase [Spirochaetes bacterium]|nr:antibiotic biosynthesis monooxygenase [Spirochaetota bacterium]
MITLIATLKIKEGKMDEAAAVLKQAVPKILKEEPGCLAYVPHRVKGEDNTVIIYEKYRDKDALKEHSANLMVSLEKLLPLLEPGMDIKTCFEMLEE